MEVDVAATHKPLQPASASQLQLQSSHSDSTLSHILDCSKLDVCSSGGSSSCSNRRRKTSIVLKSILRHSRSESGSVGLYSSRLTGCGARRQKKVVKFLVEDLKGEEVKRWSGKKLRCLALDLDKWESQMSQLSGKRSGNKQKTRRTKRVNIAPCTSFDDIQSQDSVCRLDVDDEVVSKRRHVAQDLKDSESETSVMPISIPEVETLEKSIFVRRWLKQSKEAEHDGRTRLMTLIPAQDSGSSISCEHMLAGPQDVTDSFCTGRANSTASLSSLSSVFNTMSIDTAVSRQQ